MSAKLEQIVGKSYQDIDAALAGEKKRDRLVELIKQLATVEPFFSPEEVASLRGVSVATVMKRIRSRQMKAHLPVGNKYRIPLSELRKWDEQTCLDGLTVSRAFLFSR